MTPSPPVTVTSVTAMFPCYNDARTIGGLVDSVHAALEAVVPDHEVVVVDDGSSDGAGDVLERMAVDRGWLHVVRHDVNRGYGGALISGFGAATKEWIFYTDGDAQYDPAEVVDLLAAVRPGIDVVQGYKRGRGDGWHRVVIGRVYHHVVKLLFNLHVRDTDCDFRLFRRELVVEPPLSSHTGVICVEMMRRFERSGARFVEVPVSHFPRPHGRSQFFRVGAVGRSAGQLVALWYRLMIRRS